MIAGMFDHKTHSCGCETAFDTEDWTSRTLTQCDFHRDLSQQPLYEIGLRRIGGSR